MEWFIGAPVGKVHKLYIITQLSFFKVVLGLFRHVQANYPPVFIGNLLKPFLVIIFITAVEVEYIFRYENELGNAFAEEGVYHFALELHYIVLNGIVPLTYQLNYNIMFIVIGHDHFHVQGAGTELIPLGMNIIIVYSLGVFKFRVCPAIKG